MDKLTPQYKKEAAKEDLPKKAEPPSLRICQVTDGSRLLLPRDVRASFLQDPVWGIEWREIASAFDKQWGMVEPSTPNTPSPSPAGPSPGPGLTPKKEELLDDEFNWSSVFAGEPESLDDLKQKYSERTEMTGGASYNFVLVEGPKLFMVATDACHVKAGAAPIITHGAGSWLLGEKADKFQADHPNKGVPCKWDTES